MATAVLYHIQHHIRRSCDKQEFPRLQGDLLPKRAEVVLYEYIVDQANRMLKDLDRLASDPVVRSNKFCIVPCTAVLFILNLAPCVVGEIVLLEGKIEWFGPPWWDA
jgi:hypothetical protein